ncbi:MAG TPA: serine hydroxymethyltransferase [Thermoanaerobaculia bacterium]|nr:serine hydroxymethyltransferase [Thermoanaerobaculia bacterium]
MRRYWQKLEQTDPQVYAALVGEEDRERRGIELIPSENYTYPEVFACNGSVLTNKYAEGYPGRRYYGGQEFTDVVERLAVERAKQLFRCEHANVQPLSGSPMNQAVYMAFLDPGDTVLAMDLSHGGHLTHGAPVSHMGKIFRFVRYKTKPDGSGAIDFDEVRRLALEHRPKIVLCGHSSYPREYDYAAFRRIADEVGALTMADVSHIGGLIAGKALRNPFDDGFDIVTTTTHKSLRGPRGGMILCRAPQAQAIDKAVFPGLQGGPHMNAVAGIAVTLGKALEPAYQDYCRQVLTNAQALAAELVARGAELVTGGTENHLMVVVTTGAYGIDGKVAEQTLDEVSITVNKQVIPDDPKPPLRPSGIRLGTPAATTRGMGVEEMKRLAGWLHDALTHHEDSGQLARIRAEVEEMCLRFPVPGL